MRHVFFGNVDRIYAAVTAALLGRLRSLAADPKQPFYDEREPKSRTHRRLLERIANRETDAGDFRLQSFRQEGRPSLQVVVAIPPGEPPDRACYADLDIDLGNPLQELQGDLVHIGELLHPDKTDHLSLHKQLSKGSTGEFLYYTVRRFGAREK